VRLISDVKGLYSQPFVTSSTLAVTRVGVITLILSVVRVFTSMSDIGPFRAEPGMLYNSVPSPAKVVAVTVPSIF